MIPVKPRETLAAFDAYLAARGLRLEAVVVGGTALNLLGLVSRPTNDTGRALVLASLGRLDLLRSKLFALCDRGLDLGDCMALAPTAEELARILPWLEQQDTNPNWPAHVRSTFADLAGRLGHGI
jgi:hypothetical protein